MGGPKKLRSWETKESRYYCAVCNVWMGNDRQSILLHENGKKHKENVAKSLQDKRENRAAQDKQAAQMKGALKAMEQAALQSIHTGTDSLYYDTTTLTSAQPDPSPYGAPIYAAPPPPPPPPPKQSPAGATKSDPDKKKEKQEWNARKKQRKENDSSNNNNKRDDGSLAHKSKRRTIAPDEGHYKLDNDDKTYLEGTVFTEILEEEMPIQIWVGSNLASAEEKKLPHHHDLWINGLVAAIRKKRNDDNNDTMVVVDVAYLRNPADEEETLEQGVLLHRIRIILGGDESIPETLEEARVLAMGGEEIHVENNNNNNNPQATLVDEATGLTGWSTVTIKRTTVHQEAREERAKQRQKERASKRAAEEAAKQAEVRKMEESKVQNAEDSALGAFDVWSQTQKGGYKGVDIHTEAEVSIEDTAKRLVDPKGETTKVAFKKSKLKGKMAGKKRNRRTTSADDD